MEKEKALLETKMMHINDIVNEDPKRIVSVAFPFKGNGEGKDIEIMRLTKTISVKEKVLLFLPKADNQRYYARLFSVQLLKDGNRVERIIIEAAGRVSPEVKLTAEKIANVMFKKDVTSAFFPAYEFLPTPVMPVRCYIANSFDMFHLKAVPDINIRNIRILDGNNLLYSMGNRIMKIKINDIVNNNWPLADIIYESDDDILFLDRVQNNTVIATREGNSIVAIDLSRSSVQTLDHGTQWEPHAFLKLKEFAVAVATDKLSLMPPVPAVAVAIN